MRNKSIFSLMSVMILLILSLTVVLYSAALENEYHYITITTNDGTELLVKLVLATENPFFPHSSVIEIDICNLNKTKLKSLTKMTQTNSIEDNIKQHLQIEKFKDYENVTLYDVNGNSYLGHAGITAHYIYGLRSPEQFYLDKNGNLFDGSWTTLLDSIVPNELGLYIIPIDHYTYIRDMILDEIEELFIRCKPGLKTWEGDDYIFKLRPEFKMMLDSINFYDPEIWAKYNEEIKKMKHSIIECG